RPTRQSLRRVDRIGTAVLRQIHRAHHVLDREQRPALLCLAGREYLHLETEAARHGGAALELLEPRLARRHRHRAHLPEAGRLPGLALEAGVQPGGVLGESGEVVSRAQLADESGGVPGGAAGQLPPLEQQHVAAAAAREMVGDAAADDAAADDDYARVRGDALHAVQNPAIASRSMSAIASMSARLAMKAGATIATSPVVFTCRPRS